jgi:endonuclease G
MRRCLAHYLLIALFVLQFCRLGHGQAAVSEHLTMGNPSGAKNDDSDLANRLVIKEQFVLSFNNNTASANWVSWRLDTEWFGNEERANSFRVDVDLPDLLTKVPPSAYEKTGFDQGHVCPSGDRTRDKPTNSSTFVMSNMVPQAPRNNRQTWRMLEKFSQTEAKKKSELYIIAGPHGLGGTGSKDFQSQIGGTTKVAVPAVTWKVILLLPSKEGDDVARINKDTRALGVIMPNRQDIKTDWQRYIVPIRQIEQLTGFDFFSLVPQSIQDELELR